MKKIISRLTEFHVIIISILIAIIVFAIILFSAFDYKVQSYESSNKIMQTSVKQIIYGENSKPTSKEAYEKIKKGLSKISYKDQKSEIFKINQESGKSWVDVSDKVLDMLSICMDVADMSNGAYTPTSLPLDSIWGITEEKLFFPQKNEITCAKELSDSKNLKLNKDVKRVKLLKKDCGIILDNIFNGLACDIAVETYGKNNVNSGIVTVGRTVGVYGTKQNKKDWNIAIHDPYETDDESSNFMVIKTSGGFLSTFSKFDKSFQQDNKVYPQLIDYSTGCPVENDLVCVTVFHEKGFVADLLSKACFILGRENCVEILNNFDASAVFVDQDKNVYLSDALRNSIVISNADYKLKESF